MQNGVAILCFGISQNHTPRKNGDIKHYGNYVRTPLSCKLYPVMKAIDGFFEVHHKDSAKTINLSFCLGVLDSQKIYGSIQKYQKLQTFNNH